MPVCYSENKIPFLDLDADESQFIPTDLLIWCVCVHACIMADVTHNKRLVIPLHARTHTHRWRVDRGFRWWPWFLKWWDGAPHPPTTDLLRFPRAQSLRRRPAWHGIALTQTSPITFSPPPGHRGGRTGSVLCDKHPGPLKLNRTQASSCRPCLTLSAMGSVFTDSG